MKGAASESRSVVQPKRRQKSDASQVLPFHDNFSYRLTVIYLLMVKTTAAVYAEENLTSHQWKVMSVLYHYAPIPAATIIKWSTLDKATISRTVQSLLEQRLINRRLNASDARTVDIRLTAKGLEKYSRMALRVTALQNQLFGDWPESDKHKLFEMLDDVESKLQSFDIRA